MIARVAISFFCSGSTAARNIYFVFNTGNGNLKSRTGMMTSTETFAYDSLYRLKSVSGPYSMAMDYAANGNITSKTGLGAYTYGANGAGPHAVTSVATNTGSVLQQDIKYTDFLRPEKITQGNYVLDIEYGPHQQRIKSVLKNNGTPVKTIIFAGNYERITENGVTKEMYYIGDAIFVKQAGQSGKTLYTHKDHLGSIISITDSLGAPVFRATYDPWGKQTLNPANTFSFHRGYTGHEHLPEFELINMNARLYDPTLGRMLSPDVYVQMPYSSQSYNRYTYCLNNPTIYTDPSGEIWSIITAIGDLIGKAFFQGGLDPTSKTARQNAWRNYDPTAPWSNTNKAFQIDRGLYRTDPNKNWAGRAWQFISRHTWEMPQTLIGYVGSGVQNLFGGVRSVTNYGGSTCVEMYGSGWGAVTFGSYIMGQRDIQADPDNWLFQHEYGHYLQSQATGPLYLQRYGIPSAFSGGPFKNNHDFHPAEQDANRRAINYFNEHVSGFNWTDDDGIHHSRWNFGRNPIIGYNQALAFNDPQNQLSLDYARLRPAWHDWILGPNFIISGPAIHTPVLNSKKRYHRKLNDMVNDGFVIPTNLYF